MRLLFNGDMAKQVMLTAQRPEIVPWLKPKPAVIVHSEEKPSQYVITVSHSKASASKLPVEVKCADLSVLMKQFCSAISHFGASSKIRITIDEGGI